MNLGPNLRYAAGLPRFLRHQLSDAEAHAIVTKQLAQREQTFLRVLEHGIYSNAVSPYRRLLEHASVALDDVRVLVGDEGLEGALARLYDAGVYVTYEESRGIRPIKRGNLEFSVQAHEFDNPLLAATYETTTSGSRRKPRSLRLDLAFLEYEAAEACLMFDAHRVGRSMPVAVWRPVPPDTSGLKRLLCYTKAGCRPQRWFSQAKLQATRQNAKPAALLATTLIASSFVRPLPWPRFVPLDEAQVIARWLAEQKRGGAPAFLDTSASGAVRVCLAAQEQGIDINGSAIRTGGERFTAAKAAIVEASGCRTIQIYAMGELGWIGVGCADPETMDDMHVCTDKLAVLQRDKQLEGGASVPALVYTSLLETSPLLMLNMESGDFGRVAERRCDCALDAIGLTTHLFELGAYDKVTSESLPFAGSVLYQLVEEVLPARFGGHATDYQLVEEEAGGLSRLTIVVAPRVGALDEGALVEAALQWVTRSVTGAWTVAEQWRQGGTLRVVRREPYTSGGGRKVLPLHVLRNGDAASK